MMMPGVSTSTRATVTTTAAVTRLDSRSAQCMRSAGFAPGSGQNSRKSLQHNMSVRMQSASHEHHLLVVPQPIERHEASHEAEILKFVPKIVVIKIAPRLSCPMASAQFVPQKQNIIDVIFLLAPQYPIMGMTTPMPKLISARTREFPPKRLWNNVEASVPT